MKKENIYYIGFMIHIIWLRFLGLISYKDYKVGLNIVLLMSELGLTVEESLSLMESNKYEDVAKFVMVKG
jgi:hypothetical protein